MRRFGWLLAGLTFVGCSLVNDPSAHVGGDAGPARTDAGEASDAATVDGGAPSDAGPSDAGDAIDAAADAGPERLEEGDFCAAYAEAYCNAVPLCCSTLSTVPAGCVMTIRDGCNDELAEVFTDDRIDYDPVEAAMALATGQALVDGCAVTPLLEWGTARDGLLAPFHGTIGGGMSCEPVGSSIPEQAVALLLCADPAQSCAGFATQSCLSRGMAGDPCAYALQCVDGLRCVRLGTGALAGATCEATGEDIGSHCRLSDECESLNCTATNYLVPGVCAGASQDAVYCYGASTDG